MWFLDQQHQHDLGTCQKCNTSDHTPDLPVGILPSKPLAWRPRNCVFTLGDSDAAPVRTTHCPTVERGCPSSTNSAYGTSKSAFPGHLAVNSPLQKGQSNPIFPRLQSILELEWLGSHLPKYLRLHVFQRHESPNVRKRSPRYWPGAPPASPVAADAGHPLLPGVVQSTSRTAPSRQCCEAAAAINPILQMRLPG